MSGTKRGASWGVLAALVASLFAAGCQSPGGSSPPAERTLAAQADAPADTTEALRVEGAQIWRMTCDGCHNLRLPEEYSADQWDVIISHMRVRADLTRSQARAVRAFMREAAEQGGEER